MKPVSPTAFLTKVSPITTLTEAQIRHQKMEKLTRCIGETVPRELVYPSFGQITQQAEQVGSYLELYRAGSAVDDTALDFKSPVPKDAHWEDIALGETKVERSGSQRSLRKSRSVGDFYSVADIREMQSHNAKMAARQQATQGFVESPTSITTSPSASEEAPALKRKASLSNAKAAIIGADAKLMAQFRSGFGTPKAAPPTLTAPLTSPQPESPIPSALLAIQSPRAPYWVKPTNVKTPRTRRFERRMGWGGSWNIGSMGEMVTQLKQL